MITLTLEDLATVTGGMSEAEELARIQHASSWYGNVLDKANAAGKDLGAKGTVYGTLIGAGAAVAGGVTAPAAPLTMLGGAGLGGTLGYGMGFIAGAGQEVYRTWNTRPWKP